MGKEIVEESYNTTLQSMNNQSAMQYRLGEASRIIEDIELLLKGHKVVVMRDSVTGQLFQSQIPIDPDDEGNVLANPRGRQAIISFIRFVVNSQTVQGNFREEKLDRIIEEIHISLVSDLVENCVDWQIKDDKLNYLIDSIMALIIPFLSRTQDNKERESYQQSLRTVETNITKEPEKRGLFAFGGS